MKRFLTLTIMVALMAVSFGAISTQAQTYYGYNVDEDYGGELLDEPLWEINFFLDGQLMYAAVAEESMVDYTIDTISGLMEGYWYEAESLELAINIYYVSE